MEHSNGFNSTRMWILMALSVALICKIGTPGGNTSISFAPFNQIARRTILLSTDPYDPTLHLSRGSTCDGVAKGTPICLTGFAHKVVKTIQSAQVVTFTNNSTPWTTVFASFSGGAIVATKTSVIIIWT